MTKTIKSIIIKGNKNEGLIESAEALVSYAETYLDSKGQEEFEDTPTFCCFTTKGNIIHCGKSDEEPFFPGTWDERIRLCKECRVWCRAKIKELKEKIKEKKSR